MWLRPELGLQLAGESLCGDTSKLGVSYLVLIFEFSRSI
jgi:hypothetical protein